MRSDFAIDISRIRDEARQHLKQGPVTPSDTTDVDRVISVLNQVVASEMVCYLRYTQNAIVCQGINREQVASMFTDHAAEELGHFQRVSDRVNQLGGKAGDKQEIPGMGHYAVCTDSEGNQFGLSQGGAA